MTLRSTLPVLAVALASSLAALPRGRAAEAPPYRSDDPLRVDGDDLPGPQPGTRSIPAWYDLLENTFAPRGDRARPRARNVNTLGEVPDSSWFTNRIGARPLSRDELVRGPDRGGGPVAGEWAVKAAKADGVSPGFQIEDAKGRRYLLKLDFPRHPEMASAAEVISTRLLYAIGYNVPENHLVHFHPERLRVADEVRVGKGGHRLTPERLAAALASLPRGSDGRLRALASRFIDGKPIGPFAFHGTRSDDVNDVFPHEHRRELRGYRLVCAWLNHDDSRAANTLDVYVGEPGGGHVRHYLIDFGSTLGSGTYDEEDPDGGHEHFWEPRRMLHNLLTLGLRPPVWTRSRYPPLRGVGRIESDRFDPLGWKPNYPNVAFEHMDDEDAFWAAALVMRFDDDAIRAVVATGGLSDPAAERYLAETLIRRRDRVGERGLRGVSSLAGFAVVDGELRYVDLLERHGFEPPVAPHELRVFALGADGTTRREVAVPRGGRLTSDAAKLPAGWMQAPPATLFAVRLGHRAHAVEVVLRRTAAGLDVIAIDRRAASLR